MSECAFSCVDFVEVSQSHIMILNVVRNNEGRCCTVWDMKTLNECNLEPFCRH